VKLSSQLVYQPLQLSRFWLSIFWLSGFCPYTLLLTSISWWIRKGWSQLVIIPGRCQCFELPSVLSHCQLTTTTATILQPPTPPRQTLSRSTWVSQYQKGKTSLDLLEQEIVNSSWLTRRISGMQRCCFNYSKDSVFWNSTQAVVTLEKKTQTTCLCQCVYVNVLISNNKVAYCILYPALLEQTLAPTIM